MACSGGQIVATQLLKHHFIKKLINKYLVQHLLRYQLVVFAEIIIIKKNLFFDFLENYGFNFLLY